MLLETLSFLAAEVNAYLLSTVATGTDAPVVLGNAALAFEQGQGGNGVNSLNGKTILSLVNLEEDRASRELSDRVTRGPVPETRHLPVLLNCYILFAVNRSNYTDSLKYLGQIVAFFQHQRRFSAASHPTLPRGVERLVVDLYTMNFEQVNHLWGTLGGKYLPSALYKVRVVPIDAGTTTGPGRPIEQIDVSTRGALPEARGAR